MSSSGIQDFSSFVIFLVGPSKYAVDCIGISELTKSLGAPLFSTASPHKAIVGMSSHRGTVLPVIDFRKMIGIKGYTDEVAEMSEFILAREQDHINWLEDLKVCAQSGAKFTKAIDPCLCNFGKWYESLRNDKSALQELLGPSSVLHNIFASFDAPHRRIHGIAEKVLAAAESGELILAKEMIEEAWDTDLAVMRKLFKDFLHQFYESHQSKTMIIECAGTKCAVLVDKIVSVVTLKAGDFTELPAVISEGEDAICQRAIEIKGELIMLWEPDTIIKAIGIDQGLYAS